MGLLAIPLVISEVLGYIEMSSDTHFVAKKQTLTSGSSWGGGPGVLNAGILLYYMYYRLLQ